MSAQRRGGKGQSAKLPGKKKETGPLSKFGSFFKFLYRIETDPSVLFAKKRPPPCPRSVYFNEPLPSEAFDKKNKPLKGKNGQHNWTYSTNQVITAKYNVFNFIFKNLFEQFRRIANLFFLLVVILQFFPKFATISPGVAMLPLLAVLAFTALKDGYEDIKRHQSDRSINRARVRVLKGGGWTNPNVMEAKEKSVSSAWKVFYDGWLGGKARQSKKLAEQEAARSAQPAANGAEPSAPPADAPGGGAAPEPLSTTGAGTGRNESSLDLPAQRPLHQRAMTSASSLGLQGGSHVRRQTSIGVSAFDSQYETGPDGRVRYQGRVLTEKEEAEFYAKKAPRWKKQMWEDLAVGDFVLLKNNEAIPADIVICSTSEEEDACFVETKNLDGETNLKSRHAVPELAQTLRTAQDCARALMRVDGEPLDTNMYRLNGSVVLGDRFDRDGQPLRCPVTLNQCLLRGTVLRNTSWVIGVVLMTGFDTKIIANSGNTPSKRGKVERQMEPMVFANLGLLAIIAIACAIADARIENYFFDRAAYWEYLAIFSDDNPDLNGLATFGNALITFQNIVPISLYISIEVVRTLQAYFIYDDADIYYEPTLRRTTAKSWNLSDDLGQIQYVFSDKTGTLTQNLMIFRGFAVGGITYHGDAPSAAETDRSDSVAEKEKELKASDSSDSSTSQLDPKRKRVKPRNEGVPPFRDSKLKEVLQDEHSEQAQLQGLFWRCLALCHTVLTSEDPETGVLEYKAQSPDEQALVQAAAEVGFVFVGKDRNTLTIQTPWSLDLEQYELLTVLEFSSARKRMSVILRRHSDNAILLFTKGADSVIFERAREGQEAIKANTDTSLEEFANNGLRTLCLGYKQISQHDYEEWAHLYHDASVALERREERMEELASEFERDLELLGATAIEDKLQDGVPQTIADLKRAGINVWVATGDKLETAIAIGYSTMLLSKDMNLIVVRGGEYGQPNSAYDQMRRAIERFFGGKEALQSMTTRPPGEEEEGASQHSRRSSRISNARPSFQSRRSQVSLVGEDNGQRQGGFALVIDGAALGHALSEEFSKELLLKLSTQCKAVICCRVSPLQKALIVRLVKDGLKVMTLAIGDGANDVSMIQAAHVGVGIAGEEGLQAVNSSDYAIAQFRFLKRLLLVHGHQSYYRNGTLICNFFYKNIVNIGYLFWFQIYCAWSTTQAVDYVYLLFWNAVWTVALVIAMGVFDRPISDRVLMEVPELYKRSRVGGYFGFKRFALFLLDATYQSVVLFFFVTYTYDTTTARTDGYDIQLYEFTTTMAQASVLAANFYTILWSNAWTWWLVCAAWFGPVIFFVFAPIYAALPPTLNWSYSYGNNHYLYYSAYYWFAGFLTVFLCIIPRIILRHVREVYYPHDMQVLRAIDKYDPKHDYIHDPGMPARRAAEEYGVALPEAAPHSAAYGGQGDVEASYPMHALQPTQSRASSTHYDMLTGEQRPGRGYGFSASDPEPRSKPKRKLTLKERLIPGSVRRRKERRALGTIQAEREDGLEEEERQDVDESGVPADRRAQGPGPEDDDEAHLDPQDDTQTTPATQPAR
ncbi:phospholipid-translocating P-type ATPase [Ceraceosorus guamensis]|uniref:Phospholipid-transporting ATPase n=1 Tax=Ceraceosorus guamensis TaxID=1522189 RepID=A0A316W5R5_9BASI|nr:phospholipid-translocating P-type ATPase [Ceraceosorus guamensis]PWN45004.1 phospholipid-translocating P-type ATPase [Ceraceosorus guamensis]